MKKNPFQIRVALSLFLLAGISCKKKPVAEPIDKPAKTEKVEVAADKKLESTAPKSKMPIDALAVTPSIIMEELGAKPRRALRIVVKAGDTQKTLMRMGITMAMNVNGQAAPKTILPANHMTMEVTVKKIDSDGNIHWDFEYTKVEVIDAKGVLPMVLEASKAAVAGIEGIKGYAVVSPRGLFKQGDFNVPDTLPPQVQQTLKGMKQSLAQLTIPFPKEAVGLGAKWKTVQKITQNGITLDQVGHFHIVEISDQSMVAELELEQSAQPQSIKNEQMPPGVEATLKSLHSTGKGKTHFSFNHLVPIKGHVKMDMKMESDVSAGGQHQAMTMEMGMSIEISSP